MSRVLALFGISVLGGSAMFFGAPSAAFAAGTSRSTQSTVQIVATGLNQPRKIAIAPNGDLLVTEAGSNVVPTGCVKGTEPQCVSTTGGIAEVTPAGKVSELVSNLPSVSNGKGNGPGATGPSGIAVVSGKIQLLIQNENLNPKTGAESYGSAGAWLGNLLDVPLGGGSPTTEANLGTYEGAHNPDHGEGAATFQEPVIDSDPYAVAAYDGGLAIADAAGDDVLLYKGGKLSTLAVLPVVSEHVPANALGKGQPPKATVLGAQPVPTSLAVGPDGDLYIGELGGGADKGVASVYRLAGAKLTKYAGGFSMIGDIAFDPQGRLLVLEMDQAGLTDTASQSGGLPTPGAIIRINKDGTQTTIASTGLEYPAGLAVTKNGTIYVTNASVVQGKNDPYYAKFSGELVRVTE
jgi:sugar lactone lactonase YvrE